MRDIALVAAFTLLASATLSAQAPVVGIRLGDSPTRIVDFGETFDVFVLLDNSDPVVALSCSAIHDPTKLQLNSIGIGDLSPAFPVPGVPPAFQETTLIDNASGTGFIAAAGLSLSDTFFFPAGTGWQYFVANHTNLMTDPGESIEIEFVDGVLANLPSPPVFNGAQVVGGIVVAGDDLAQQNLTIMNFTPPSFIRGKCQSNGTTLGLADVIAALQFLFLGGPPPECAEACDANDDGLLSFADPITLLSRLFGGAPPLPAPSGDCGFDPDPANSIGCMAPTSVCIP